MEDVEIAGDITQVQERIREIRRNLNESDVSEDVEEYLRAAEAKLTFALSERHYDTSDIGDSVGNQDLLTQNQVVHEAQ